MKRLMAIAVVAVLAGTTYGASLKKGTQEVVLDGVFDANGILGNQTDLGVKYGQFIADNVEVGVDGSLNDNDVYTLYGIGGFAEYNIDLGSELVPYVGVGGGWLSLNANSDAPNPDANADAFGFNGEVGVKYFLASNVAVSLAGRYAWASDDVYYDNGDLKDNNTTLNLAMRFFIP